MNKDIDITERLRDDEMYADACDEAARLIEQQRADLAALTAENEELKVDLHGMMHDCVGAEEERDELRVVMQHAIDNCETGDCARCRTFAAVLEAKS